MSTSNKIRFAFCAAALILPTLVLGGVVLQRLAELETAPVVYIPIAGYDPVDILHGHFIRFNFDMRAFGSPSVWSRIIPNYTVCFHADALNPDRTSDTNIAEFVDEKEKPAAKKSCALSVPNSTFFSLQQKFFVDERYAAQLDKIIAPAIPRIALPWQTRRRPSFSANNPTQEPDGATEPTPRSRVTVAVAVSPSGALRLKMLYIDGKPWRESIDSK